MANLLILLYVAAASLGLIFVKLGTEHAALPLRFVEGKLYLSFNGFVFAGIFLYGVSFLVYMYLLSRFDLGYIIPLTTALVYTVILCASFFVFHEAFTFIKIVGVTLILAGVILLNLNK